MCSDNERERVKKNRLIYKQTDIQLNKQSDDSCCSKAKIRYFDDNLHQKKKSLNCLYEFFYEL